MLLLHGDDTANDSPVSRFFFLMQNLIAGYHFLRLYNKLPDSVIYTEDHLDFMILSADRDGLEANLT